MSATVAYRAKRALFDLLAVQAQPGFPLDGVQVSYQAPGEASQADLFGGGIRFEQSDLSGEPDAMVINEIVHVTMIVRVSSPEMTIRESDAEVERIADVLADLFATNTWLDEAKELTVLGFATGLGDYEASVGWGRSMLVLEVDVQCLIQ